MNKTCRKCGLPDTEMYEEVNPKYEAFTGKIVLCSHCNKSEKILKMKLIQ